MIWSFYKVSNSLNAIEAHRLSRRCTAKLIKYSKRPPPRGFFCHDRRKVSAAGGRSVRGASSGRAWKREPPLSEAPSVPVCCEDAEGRFFLFMERLRKCVRIAVADCSGRTAFERGRILSAFLRSRGRTASAARLKPGSGSRKTPLGYLFPAEAASFSFFHVVAQNAVASRLATTNIQKVADQPIEDFSATAPITILASTASPSR